LQSTQTFYYNPNWPDQLTSIVTTPAGGSPSTRTITYDAMGNRLTDGNNAYNWQGRQLSGLWAGGVMYDYKYNSDGLRSKKIMASMGVETRYLYDGGRLVAQITGTQANFNNFFSNSTNCEIIWFLYDHTGIIGFTRKTSGSANETTYFYRKNVQGDITGIYQHMLGVLLAEYRYDAWGNLLGVFNPDGTVNTSTSFIGNVNPIRYRGYYYDRETGFYLLGTRYYDPQTSRFISPDDTVTLGMGFENTTQYNLYAYCWNDPVNMVDDNGYWPEKLVKKLAGASWDKLNAEERRVACKDPLGARSMGTAQQLAYSWGKHYYGLIYNDDNIQANAFRHAFWNAAGVLLIGSSRTKKFTDAHEWGTSGESTNMDYFNNAAGRVIGELYKQNMNTYHWPAGSKTRNTTGFFYYYGVKISVTGDHYANLALMVKTAANQGNGKVLKWIK